MGGPTPPLHIKRYTLTALADRDPRGTTQAAPLPEGSCHAVVRGMCQGRADPAPTEPMLQVTLHVKRYTLTALADRDPRGTNYFRASRDQSLLALSMLQVTLHKKSPVACATGDLLNYTLSGS